jgi:hypothetical protein
VTTRGEDVRPSPQPEAATALKAEDDSARSAGPTQQAAPAVLLREFMLTFRSAPAAGAAATALSQAGFTTSISQRDGQSLVDARKRLSDAQAKAAEEKVKEIAKRYGGRYAGAQ